MSPGLGRSPPAPLQSRKWQPTPICLPGKSHGQRTLVGSKTLLGANKGKHILRLPWVTGDTVGMRGLPLQVAHKWKGDLTLCSGMGMPGQAGHTSEWPVTVRISNFPSTAKESESHRLALLSKHPLTPLLYPHPQPDPGSRSQSTSRSLNMSHASVLWNLHIWCSLHMESSPYACPSSHPTLSNRFKFQISGQASHLP